MRLVSVAPSSVGDGVQAIVVVGAVAVTGAGRVETAGPVDVAGVAEIGLVVEEDEGHQHHCQRDDHRDHGGSAIRARYRRRVIRCVRLGRGTCRQELDLEFGQVPAPITIHGSSTSGPPLLVPARFGQMPPTNHETS